MSVLTLVLKAIYFDQIKAGEKLFEYREVKEHWRSRLVGREYETLVLTRGYAPKWDESRRLIMPYRGFETMSITHPHFGPNPVDVFAIHASYNHEASNRSEKRNP